MAYHGYIPAIKRYLSGINEPKVLEIGLDKGITTIPLVVFLSRWHKKFEFIGVDIKLQEQLMITLKNIDMSDDQKVTLYQKNSLELLLDLEKSEEKFDVVLIDGDHNYYTVKKELQYLDSITKDTSIVIIDDYHGRWSEKDLWYSEREGYESITTASRRIETEKQGVKPAVDDYLVENDNWQTQVLVQGEPIVLYRKKKNINNSIFGI